jgi:hypothetical protein
MEIPHPGESGKVIFNGDEMMCKLNKWLTALVLGLLFGCSGCDVYISGFPLYDDVDCGYDGCYEDCYDDCDTEVIIEDDYYYDDYYYYEDYYYDDYDDYYGYYKVKAGKRVAKQIPSP